MLLYVSQMCTLASSNTKFTWWFVCCGGQHGKNKMQTMINMCQITQCIRVCNKCYTFVFFDKTTHLMLYLAVESCDGSFPVFSDVLQTKQLIKIIKITVSCSSN